MSPAKTPHAENVVTLELDPPTATRFVRELANDSSRVFFTTHAEAQMNKRHITRTQVLRCLRLGRIVEGPARGVKGNWELAVEVLSAGEPLRVAAALDYDGQSNFVIVITAYKI